MIPNKHIMKKEVEIIVEQSSDGTYAAYMEDDMELFGLAGYGENAEEAINDLYTSLEETRMILSRQSKSLPELQFSIKYKNTTDNDTDE